MTLQDPNHDDLRSRYTSDSDKKRKKEISSIRYKGIVKSIIGSALVIVGIYIMLIDETFLLFGTIPVFFGFEFALCGIVNLSSGMDMDEFPRGMEIVLKLLPLLIAGLVFWYILNHF